MSLLFCWDGIVNRPQAVILLSSESPATRGKKVKLCKSMVKRRRDWGGEGKKDARRGFIVFWITISETEMRDWSATCDSVNTKKSQSQGSHCSSNFCRMWWPDKNCSHCTPVSKWKRRSVNGLTSGTWNIFTIKIYPIFALMKFLCVTAKGSWQILNWSIILYCQAFLAFHFILRLLWETLV